MITSPNIIHFSSDPRPMRSSGDTKDHSAEILFQSFLHKRPSRSWARTFTLWRCSSSISSADRSTAHPTKCAEGWFGRGCDMPKPWEFPAVDIYQMRFLWAHKIDDLALHTVVGFVLQEGNTQKIPKVLSLQKTGSFCLSQPASSMSHSHRRWWDDKRLVQFELAKLMVFHRQILFNLAVANTVDAMLMPFLPYHSEIILSTLSTGGRTITKPSPCWWHWWLSRRGRTSGKFSWASWQSLHSIRHGDQCREDLADDKQHRHQS